MAWDLGRYIKTALVNRWNLLALAGGAAFSVISGHAEIFLPLLAAGEVAYLGFVGTHPKFQTYVDIQEARGNRSTKTTPKKKRNSSETAMRILKSLPVEARDRFKSLRSRLLELREIGEDLKRHQEESGRVGLEVFQLEGLDRLLWVFLRLQFTQASVGRFLERTDEDKIRADIARLEKRLGKLEQGQGDDPEHLEKIRATLVDNLETSQARLANYKKAEGNHEYIDLELDRLENKITSLAELAVNRQEPAFITSQVDQVARSMIDTEVTLNELDFVTHLGPVEDQAPELLRETIYISD